jgi:hypothetical protein
MIPPEETLAMDMLKYFEIKSRLRKYHERKTPRPSET